VAYQAMGKRFFIYQYSMSNLWSTQRPSPSQSEGGGFQKHNPGDPMPCDGELRVDVILTKPKGSQ
jgi:hypothetical protein